jgi:PTS system galactitol-specific IIA component
MSDNFDLDHFQINQDLVIAQMEVKTAPEVITELSRLLFERGYVKSSYAKAAIEREKEFPTGLPTQGCGTAIPHADIEHTIKPGIAVGTLKESVKFGQLGDASKQIDVSIVFLLSVTKPSAQVYLLQALVEVYKDQDLLCKLVEVTEPSVIVEEVNNALSKIKGELKLS